MRISQTIQHGQLCLVNKNHIHQAPKFRGFFLYAPVTILAPCFDSLKFIGAIQLSGLRVTVPTGEQSRIDPDQLAGLSAQAWVENRGEQPRRLGLHQHDAAQD